MVVENIVLSLQTGSAGEVSLFKKHDFDYWAACWALHPEEKLKQLPIVKKLDQAETEIWLVQENKFKTKKTLDRHCAVDAAFRAEQLKVAIPQLSSTYVTLRDQ